METADGVPMRNDLVQVSLAIAQGKRVLSVIRINIGFAIAMKAVLLVLAPAGFISLWLAVAADKP